MKKELNNEVPELVKHLPKKLSGRINVEALEGAIDKGMLCIQENWKLRWNLENRTLLAYFCGRMWCGDYCTFSSREKKWLWRQPSGVRFPKKDLVDLFDVRNLRTMREQRKDCVAPQGREEVDKLFQKVTDGNFHNPRITKYKIF